ncbi:MAG: reverse transcriptase family protein [Paraburkholderia tropica]|uniref:reverse transcriptase family protein n=1 Tax=Paraburkholderia tropica TaxID=92647 RepID=UPI003101AB6A
MAKKLIQRKNYSLTKSPFFRLHSRDALARLFGLTLPEIEAIVSSPSNALYKMYEDVASKRYITAPLPSLAHIHKRIARLFARVAPPAYLQSATKKRSYKTNAELHKKNSRIFKIDIQKYYESINYGAIFNFFKEKMQCSVDVSTMLARLCTVSARGRTHLPTGSSLSPILSYWVHCELFDRIKSICDSAGCVMSLYVDDITVSGVNATTAMISKLQNEIAKVGLISHKIQMFDGVPATITGVIVHAGRLALPHNRAKDIRLLRQSMDTMPSADADATLSKLVGKLNEAGQFVAGYNAIKKNVLTTHATVWTRITENRVAKSKAAARRKRAKLLAGV